MHRRREEIKREGLEENKRAPVHNEHGYTHSCTINIKSSIVFCLNFLKIISIEF